MNAEDRISGPAHVLWIDEDEVEHVTLRKCHNCGNATVRRSYYPEATGWILKCSICSATDNLVRKGLSAKVVAKREARESALVEELKSLFH